MTQIVTQSLLYDRDFVAWCEDTVAKLKTGRFAEIDINSLSEEIEGLAGRDKRELKNRLRLLINHLLKGIYVESPDEYWGWELTIREQRRQILDLLEQSPSLGNYLVEVFAKCWEDALTDAREDYPKVQFPDEWMFSRDIDALLRDQLW
ncbi:DUF29 domain-containing protein [Microseira wollei]|uniref:DUF29 domain-containing protein n=1 Tax=Microseira wollei NIES-4236 TaxID=2530354 RepID=A0AAV3XBM6_9CYAN|nr:DUF29 domain-containing protein [Microseira wollei]GET39694.1 protein of unknown function DUF29 [Microseira wollei NIES-4236]